MYLDYYCLELKPFEINPDPKFFWPGEKHAGAVARLKYGISQNNGFISLTGKAGIGKTTVVNALKGTLGDQVIFAHIYNPSIKKLDFFKMIADLLGMDKGFNNEASFLIDLEQFLNHACDKNKEVVLIIDEAQTINQKLLEPIRLLSNIERQDKKLITFIFVGQSEFIGHLEKNEALRQRFSSMYYIEPLTESETEEYIQHRLKVAGVENRIFSQGAIGEIYLQSKGIPRLINIICDQALLTGYEEEQKIIQSSIIKNRLGELQISQFMGQDEVGTSTKKMVKVKDQLENLEVQKTSAETQLGALKPKYVKAVAELNGLATAKERIAELERQSIEQEQLLSRTEQKVTGLKKELEQEKESKKLLQAELSSKATPIAELRVKAKTSKTDIRKLKDEVEQKNESANTVNEEQPYRAPWGLTRRKMAYMAAAALASLACLMGFFYYFGSYIAPSNTGRADYDKKTGLSTHTNSETLMSDVDKMAKRSKNTAKPEAQSLDVYAPEATKAVQSDPLKTNTEKQDAVIVELHHTKELVATLKLEADRQEQLLSRTEQKVTELKKELEQEKKSKKLLQAELSSKEDSIAVLQKKYDALNANTLKFREDTDKRTKEMAMLKDQLQNLEVQKTSAETQLGALKPKYVKAVAERNGLETAKERIAELERQSIEQEQLLSRTEQKVTELKKELEQEKKSKELLQAELSSQTVSVNELQEKLEAKESVIIRFEDEIKRSRDKIKKLQGLLMDHRIQKVSSESSPAIIEMQNKESTKSDAINNDIEPPSPTDIIDFVIKKKSEQ